MVFVASKCSHGSKIPLGFVHVIVFRNKNTKMVLLQFSFSVILGPLKRFIHQNIYFKQIFKYCSAVNALPIDF